MIKGGRSGVGVNPKIKLGTIPLRMRGVNRDLIKISVARGSGSPHDINY